MGVRKLLCVVLVPAVVVVAVADADAATYAVPASYNTIQAAIDASANGDVVVLAPGVYRGVGNRDLDYRGKLITVRGTAPDDPTVVTATVIDCQQAGRGFLFQTNETATAVLEGVTITNGSATEGGAISCTGTACPTIRMCIFLHNSIPGYSYTGCAIHYSSTGTLAIRNCVFAYNGTNGTTASGAGIAIWQGNVTIADCLFLGNVGNSGAGIWTRSSATMLVSNCTFLANTASGAGGGISVASPGTSITNCRFSGNTGSTGGAISISKASPTIANCVMTGNRATSYGGAIYVSDATSTPVVTHCTVAGNTATTAGGGIYSASATPTVTNCVFWSDLPQEISVSGTGPTMTYCDVQGGWTGFGNLDADPLLAMANDAHLMPGSPCVDAGTATPPGGLPPTDAEGKARPQDGDGDGNALPDVGAYESMADRPCFALPETVLEYVRPVGGANPPDQTFSLRNSGSGTLAWQAVEACPWMEVIPLAGTSSGEVVQVAVRVNADGLTPGDYAGSIVITDNQAANNPRTAQVTLHVGQTLRVPGDYLTIGAAISCASDGDLVLVADGRYSGSGNVSLDLHGRAIAVRSEHGPEKCTIECRGQGSGFTFHSGETPTTVVDGFTISGQTDDSYGYSGMSMIRCSPTIANCRILEPQGWGIYCTGGSPLISNCVIDGTSGATGLYGRGGLYSADNALPVIRDCTIGGFPGYHGVDIFRTASAILQNSRIWGNGTGVRCDGGTVTIDGCEIRDNSAGTAGDSNVYTGGGLDIDGTATIRNSRITGNYTNHQGGGIYIRTESFPAVTISDTIISHNTSGYGGGIYCYDRSKLTMVNCTVCKNDAVPYRSDSVFPSEAGGLMGLGDIHLYNCIFRDNTAGSGPNLVFGGSSYSGQPATAIVRHCNVEGGRDKVVAPPVMTLTWDDSNIDRVPEFAFPDDYHVLAGSACVDAGMNDVPDGLPATDLDGNSRAIDGHGMGIAVADIGAYEYNPEAPSIAVWPAEPRIYAIQESSNSTDEVLSIRNCGGGTLHWAITESCDWLEAMPASGQSNGEINQVTLRVSLSAMTPGCYSCTLRITDSQGLCSSVAVPVSLRYNAVLHMPGPYRTIQGAIDSTTQDGDVVVVGDGTWTGVGMKNLTLRGRGITVRSADGPDHCTIDCEGSGSGFVFDFPTGTPGVIEGFTVTRGSDSGIKISAGYPTIRNCHIVNNTAANGGGIFVGYYSPTIVDCEIRSNVATSDGGAIYYGTAADYSTLTNCTVSNNQAGRNGGGCYVDTSCVLGFTNCTISGNTAVGNGGGLYVQGSIRTDSPCTLSWNRAVQGGGIFANSSSPLISNWTVLNNTATDRGGGVGGYKSAMTLENCLLYLNRADYRGGGVAIQWPDTYNAATIENCTFAMNTAGDAGGGVFLQHGSGCTSNVLKNTILWGDSASAGPEIGLSSAASYCITLTATYSDVQGGPASVLIENSARLRWGTGSLDTLPGFVSTDSRDYHLTGASPCIDAGDPASDYSLEPQPNGGRINMGAYGNTVEAETKGWLYIQGYGQVRKTRVGRTLFEYEFNIAVHNAGSQSADDVAAQIVQVPAGVDVVDGLVNVGTVAAGETVISQDTFTIRLDRSTLSTLPITWRVTYTGGTSVFAIVLDLSEPAGTAADLDGDGDVDREDLLLFEACTSGPAIPYAGHCNEADFDGDGDVDQSDFGLMQRCFNGMNRAPACE